MPTFTIELPDGRKMKAEAPDEAAAISGAKDWYAANSGEPRTAPADKPNRTSALGAGLEGVAQGLSFGFADELEAAVKAAARKLLGDEKDMGAIYDESVENARGRATAAANEHPLAYYGGEIGSAFAMPGGLAKLGIKSAVRAAEGAGIGTRMAAGAKEGAAYGAAYGAGKAEGELEDRAVGAAGGAAFGGGIGGVAPAVIDAASGVLRPIANGVRAAARPEAEAARRTSQAVDEDFALFQNRQMPADEVAKRQKAGELVTQGRAGEDLRNIDLAGENTRALARSAANNSPEARDILQRSNDQRFEGQSGRAVEFIRGLVTTPGNAPRTREALADAAKLDRAPLYKSAYKAGEAGIATHGLKALTEAPAFESAMKAAVKSIGNKAAAGRGSGPQGKNGPTLAFWDQVSRELRDQYTTLSRQGANEAAADVHVLRRQLLDELDAAVPEFRQARGVAAEYFKADDAIEAGENFVSGKFAQHEAAAALKRMSPVEQEAFREGFVSKLIDNVERTGDRRNILGRIAESPAARQRIETALGPNRARELEAFMYLEQLMDLPRRAMGNSTTARQLVEIGLAGGTGMLTSAATGGTPSIFDPTTLTVAALTFGARKGKAHIDQDMARRIAQMLVSNDEAAFRKGVQQVAHTPMMDGLRNMTIAFGKAAKTAGAGLVGGTVAAQDATQRLQTTEGNY